MVVEATSRKAFEVYVEPETVEKRTVFMVTPLTTDQYISIQKFQGGRSQEEVGKDPGLLSFAKDILADSLVGWRNFYDPDTGSDCSFEAEKTIQDAVERIPIQIRSMIFRRLVEKGVVKKELEKN